MKLRVAFWRTFTTFLIATILLMAAFFFMFFETFVGKEWTWVQPTIIAVVVVSSIAFFIPTYLNNYYIVQKKYLIQHKGRREYIYYFSEVLYIDEKQSEKKKVICFFTNKGHVRYLTFDKEGKIYKAMIAGAKNRMSTEEFKENYPKIKL